jgi:hypothetical protein
LRFALLVNGQEYRLAADSRTTLLDALREQIGLTRHKPLARYSASPGRAHSRLTRHTDSSDVTTTLLNPAVQRGQCWAPIRGQSSTPIDNSSTSFLCRRRIPLSIRLVSRDGAKSPMSEHRRRLPMLFVMRPEHASVNCRLESKNCSREIRMGDHSFPGGALSIVPTNAQIREIVS